MDTCSSNTPCSYKANRGVPSLACSEGHFNSQRQKSEDLVQVWSVVELHLLPHIKQVASTSLK